MKKENVYGYVSTVCCTLAAFWIAVIGEIVFAPWAWVVYTVGAVTGIIHLNRKRDRSTMFMYIIWMGFDLYAIGRLLV